MKNRILPLTSPWSEDEATWDKASNGVSWNNPGMSGGDMENWYLYGFMTYRAGGGDFDTSYYTEEINEGEWESYDVTTMVQEFVSGESSNYGFLFHSAHDKASIGRDYYSSEAADIASRPKLIITTEGGTAIQDVHPKESQSLFTLNGNTLSFESDGLFEVTLMDMRGRFMHREQVSGRTTYGLVALNLSQGCYLLKVKSGVAVSTVPILIK